jgi:dTDP-4-dehydrorhamnose 3,5-epimerase
LPGVRLLELDRYDDERGWFMELWNDPRYRAAGVPAPLVQVNVSRSRRGVLRGLHFQAPAQQAKLIAVPHGAVYDAIVDVRLGSPTFGRWFGCELSEENRRQLWVPEGFAHGFLVRSETALVCYGCTSTYDPASDRGIVWNDPDVGITWPEPPLMTSAKDANAPRLADLRPADLPVHDG